MGAAGPHPLHPWRVTLELEHQPSRPVGAGDARQPLPVYARMRQEAPFVRLIDPYYKHPIWVATRYKDAVELMRDPRFTKDIRKLPANSPARQNRVGESDVFNQHMLSADPPDHTRLRTLVSKAFTPRRVEELRPRITAISQRLLDAVQAKGSMDLLDAYAFPAAGDGHRRDARRAPGGPGPVPRVDEHRHQPAPGWEHGGHPKAGFSSPSISRA